MVLQLCGRVCRRLSFEKPRSNERGFLFLLERRVRTSSSVRRLSFEKPRSNERGFLFYNYIAETRHALSLHNHNHG